MYIFEEEFMSTLFQEAVSSEKVNKTLIRKIVARPKPVHTMGNRKVNNC